MNKNLFIAFEGIDGSGKSTQVQLLAENLKQAGHKIYLTAEPTNSSIGKLIRTIFSHQMEADHRTIAGLFVADRLHHLLDKEEGLLKKMEEGYTVISDRYYFSSYAYQGAHLSLEWVIQANILSAQLLKPDLNVFIDIGPETSMQRIKNSRENIELFETLENLKLVKETYFKAFELLKNQEQIFIADGEQEPQQIASQIYEHLKVEFKC
jgi:dTMP kinase